MSKSQQGGGAFGQGNYGCGLTWPRVKAYMQFLIDSIEEVSQPREASSES